MISIATGPPASVWRNVVEAFRSSQPGLVGEHVQARVVKPSHQRDLPVVASREDHHLARPIRQQALERPISRAHHRAPRRRALQPSVEGLDQREKVVELTAGRRVDEDLVADARVALAQGERGMEMAGIEERERVHRRRDIIIDRSRGVWCR
jgi:hypothetical protein